MTAPGGALFPDVIEDRAQDGERTVQFSVPDSLFYFTGHFPDSPVVPAFVQLRWILDWAVPVTPGWTFTGLEAAKFLEPLVAGPAYTAKIRLDSTRQSVRFEIQRSDHVCSSGKIFYGRNG